ncbi:iron uptake transporter deferrochelatase/peroxidase subunit [Glaciimonas sp. PAMC28666]|uniref:iron uptake transporter deferrochelatase/peroxidase subunit n=1 Tax=Glaciimonas sp. PAMC28666 TaxID=2807626 RepID=UPI001962C1D8|nr:iron uptake transporter deferrochelatase/peroxidase subunit [Glaciimonas sp. PAMC28666]QRX82181.1 deferrochelatase/peroxidase EfeB [Glaciimonas sp. PAMC28666]
MSNPKNPGDPSDPKYSPTRRRFMTRAAVVAATAPVSTAAFSAAPASGSSALPAIEPFWGKYQAGVATPMQRHTYFMAFDVVTTNREELIAVLKAWTEAAAAMSHDPAQRRLSADVDKIPEDSGDILGLSPARLTVTFGFGPSLFGKEGDDRFGLAKQRPAALADLPRFTGDQLIAERTGGDISVQACADDPQVAEHAIRRLVALAYGMAKIRWAQTGFAAGVKSGETPRNQMGFKDGTMNIRPKDAAAMKQFVWVGNEGPGWMRNGTYVVIRPTRIALEHWDRMKLGFQEQTVGRHKYSGAPIGKQHEFEPLDLDANDKDGNPLIAETSHARLAAPESNDGAQILRRAYAYDNGVTQIAERWPPWRQAMTFDAGLLFQCYQRDPRTGFTKIFEKMAKLDMLNQFTTHIGSGLFACPPGAQKGEYIGQRLFEAV